MRITKYDLLLDEDRKNVLVKEDAKNCTFIKTLNTPQNVVDTLNFLFQASKKPEEHVWLIALDMKCNPIGVFEVSHGSVNNSLVYPREIFVRLCLCGASNFVLAHNHPSGVVVPSNDDIKITERVIEAGKLMNIPLLDHIIIGDGYYSFKENQLVIS